MNRLVTNRLGTAPKRTRNSNKQGQDESDYFRTRDFEYVQPLYDLAFLLEIAALAEDKEIPKYRTFSLRRAAYSLDGYGTTIDQWLDGKLPDSGLDYVPSARIAAYLDRIRKTGSIPELRELRSKKYRRALRLRGLRGLGPAQIVQAILSESMRQAWVTKVVRSSGLDRDHIVASYHGTKRGPWQTAHIVPPILRFLREIEDQIGDSCRWSALGIDDPFGSVWDAVTISADTEQGQLGLAVEKALKRQQHFHRGKGTPEGRLQVRHQLGWSVEIGSSIGTDKGATISELIQRLDPIGSSSQTSLLSDLHVHTAWSDGSASIERMAEAVIESGLEYFAVTDHSRSCKLQGGLTPIRWLRQANALSQASAVSPILHGVEVDILRDGSLDLPRGLLAAAELVIGSVHTSWAGNARANTNRLLTAIESGSVDILAHPSSRIIGKPGVPDYFRPPADMYWEEIFDACARWKVAVEFNCFPSRLDLPVRLLKGAVHAGCAISLGSDAHARSHLLNLRFGQSLLKRVGAKTVLNRMPYEELQRWVSNSRSYRSNLTCSRVALPMVQQEFSFEPQAVRDGRITLGARIQRPSRIPSGPTVVGIDLTAGNKLTGLATITGKNVETCSLASDQDILDYILEQAPELVSIDSPLGVPGGSEADEPNAGIVRVAERDLASIGISAYPALIDSMKNLTLRGINLRKAIENLPKAPQVIESYPGAAQDILCIPRKQKSLALLREGLARLGLTGKGLQTESHDEMDAITSAVVGRYYETGDFEPMGVETESQLIVPKNSPLIFDQSPVICLAGKTGAGKSTVARYLAVFYGFLWIRTRDLVRGLLLDDINAAPSDKLADVQVQPEQITEQDLRTFGAILLDIYHQAPLRKRLKQTIEKSNLPIVIDSIRDTTDVDRRITNTRPIVNWFVDCTDSIIRKRLEDRAWLGQKKPPSGSSVDRNALKLRVRSDTIIANNSSLEELRWRVDDTLFQLVNLRRC